MDDDRRVHPRYRLWLPTRIEGAGPSAEQDEALLAIGHDISQKGSLLVTRAALPVGARIVLHVRIPPESDEEQRIEAHVVRCGPNSADPEGLWPVQIAVEFEEPEPGIERLSADLVRSRKRRLR